MKTKMFICFTVMFIMVCKVFFVPSLQAATAPTGVEVYVPNFSETRLIVGTVGTDGGSPLIVKGVCWNNTSFPNISDPVNSDKCTKDYDPETGEFKADIIGLNPDSDYYFKAYAKNAIGLSWSSEFFSTGSGGSGGVVTPTVITALPTVTSGIVTTGGTVISDGGASVTARGICWSASAYPTVTSGTEVADSSPGAGGSFASVISGLIAGNYHVRAFATNSAGTGYGEDKSFTITGGGGTTPVLTTLPLTDVGSDRATVRGNLVSDSGTLIIEKGVCWSEVAPPDITDNKLKCTSSGSGEFSITITGLFSGKKYYVRTYAKVYTGSILYGSPQLSFTTTGIGTAVAPTVTTTATPITVTHNFAIIEGTVLSDGGAVITERGVCRGLQYNPDSNNGICVSDYPLETEESFEIEIKGLTPDTLYHARAFAKNSAGKTGYGEDVPFYTEHGEAVSDPTVKITSISDMSSDRATVRGKITSNGGASITDKGICWNKSPEDPMFGEHISSNAAGEDIEAVITQLESGTKYYVRAYAANTAGNTGYSTKEYFTASGTVPGVTTVGISDVTKYSAAVSGNVTADAGTVITEKGVCWGETSPPTIEIENKVKYYASGPGSFEVTITGLNPETKYYVRAFAINSRKEISYGSPELSFTTLPDGGSITAPSVKLTAVASVTSGGATVLGQILSDGGSLITAKGVCWGTSENPTLTMCLGYTNEGEGTAGTSFTSLITGLKPLTKYYVRTYAKNSAGRTGYGDPQFTFTTTDGGSSGDPAVTTTAIMSVAPDGATVRGNVNSDSSFIITEKGFYCSETSPPTLDDNKWTYAYSGFGDFEIKITGLKSVTKYYVIAYAKTSTGKLLYGSPQLSFITSNADAATAPSVITTAVTGIRPDSANVTGKIISDGGASITAKGFCWSLSTHPTLNNCLGHTNEGSGVTGIPFASLITGLDSGIKYYVSAYATNAVGKTGYGDPQFSFTTPADIVMPPTLTTVAVNSVTLISATVTGKIISDGGASITAKGFCWSMQENPTLDNNFAYANEDEETAGDSFTGSITGLSSGTLYYVRAYATNSEGETGYGDLQLSFSTKTDDPTGSPVTLTKLSNITYNSLKINIKVLSDVAEKGVCYSKTSPPTVDDKKQKASSGTGDFEITVTGLDSAAKYYIRPYSIDSGGNILYGFPQLSFITAEYIDEIEAPTVTIIEVTDVTVSGASVTGKVVSDGGASLTAKGFCWSRSENPTLDNCLGFTEEDGGTDILFTRLITDLNSDTTYYVRAFATNSLGRTGYGYLQFSFTTKSGEVSPPTVVTSVTNSVTSDTATVTGKVLSDGGTSLTAKGFCWGLSENPTLANCLGCTNEGGGTAGFSFTSSITGLNAATSYYVRAFATNSFGKTGYGDPHLSFTTLSAVPLFVTTDSVTAIKWDGATVRGKIAPNTASVIIERGICCSETSPPTLDNKWTAASGGPGDFEVLITELKPETKYYVRAFAIDSEGNVTYGTPQLSFVTDQANPETPTVETVEVTDLTETGANVIGKVVSDGGAAITAKGFCWSRSENPTLDNCLGSTDDGAGETAVAFTSAISGLSPETSYYVRAFATNSAEKTGYGASLSFTTDDNPPDITEPSVTTLEVTPVTLNAVTVSGKVVSDGGAAITAKGFCWGLSENPTTDNCLGYTSEGGGTAGGFTSSISALNCDTTYYIRAYAKNSAEKTGYGNSSLSFSIPCVIPDSVIMCRTSFIGEVTATGVTIRASVTLHDGAAVIEKGICCSENSPPTIDNKWPDALPEPGNFEIKITGLGSDTKYYIRAYAIDADGKIYYEEQQFPFITSGPVPPVIETVEVTDVRKDSATVTGKIVSDGGAPLTTKGFCWDTSKNPALNNCLSSTQSGGTTDSFTASITGLKPDTAYYVRAYATNSAGKTGYGSNLDFKTPSVQSDLMGDIDKNGIVNVGDAILILKVLTGKSASGIHNMDVNGDKRLGIEDVIYILRELSKQTM